MILTMERWNEEITILSTKPTKITFQNINLLNKYIRDIKSLCKGEEGSLTIYDRSNQLSFEKEVEIITSVFDITLNNTKTLTYLRKHLEKDISHSDLIFEVDKLKDGQLKLLNKIKNNSMINFTFNDDITILDLLKFYEVKFNEHYDSLLELLIKYLEILKEYSKTKVVFLVMLFGYFNSEDISEIVKFCTYNDIILVFLECKITLDTTSTNDIYSVYMDNDIIFQ